METVIASIEKIKYHTILQADGNQLIADESIANGGLGKHFTPKQLLASALASCTLMTLRMYADHKQWDLQKAETEVTIETADGVSIFKRDIHVFGTLDDEQKEKLLVIANKCPVHKILSHTINITTSLA